MTSAESAIAAVDTIFNELSRLVAELQAGCEPHYFAEQLDRWKRRSMTTIAAKVSSGDAACFGRLRTQPSWVNIEDGYDGIIREHQGFLAALYKELNEHPEHYASRLAVEQVTAAVPSSAPKRKQPLEVPERATVPWLFRHLTLGAWGTIVAVLAAAFVLGFKLAQIPETAAVLSRVLGEGPPASVAAPAAAPGARASTKNTP